MRRPLLILVMVLLLCPTAWADILLMKSGEYKRGKILKETEDEILFKSENDNAIVVVRRPTISLIEKETPPEQMESKGSLSMISAVPMKKSPVEKRDWLPAGGKNEKVDPIKDQSLLKDVDQSKLMDQLEAFLQKALTKYPQLSGWYTELKAKTENNKQEMEKLSKIAEGATK